MKVTQSADSQPFNPPKAFRYDINGLRAWAVVAVVLYHFGVPGFAGGFVGVDVFFVISGFLMTGIIITGLERGNFSLWGFYLARARRIIPALLVLCVSLLILGWFWLPNADYRMLASHVGTAVVFISNVKFWREAGYFDAASHEKWLLHTWSLSVEWQFYILLPLCCLLVWHWFGKRGVKLALVVAGLLSLALSIYVSERWPGAAFYLLPTRAWEMLAGGLVWWGTRTQPMPRQWAALAELGGFVLIILAITTFDRGMLWPGYLALVPVVGAMLVLSANRQRSWLTANFFASRLGASSYSIYLWHWPLVVLLTYIGEQSNSQWIVAGVFGSLLLGELSLRGVENPARKGFAKLGIVAQGGLLAVMSGVVGLAVVSVFLGVKYSYPVFSQRLDAKVNIIADESLNVKPRRDDCFVSSGVTSPACVYGGNKVKAILLGDSHADAVSSGLAASVLKNTDGILDLTYASCPTIFGLNVVSNDNSTKCKEFNSWAKEKISVYSSDIPLVIVNRTSVYAFGQHNIKEQMNMPLSYFDIYNIKITDEFLNAYSDGLIESACELAKQRPVYIMRPIPEMMVDVPKTMARALAFGKQSTEISISLEEYHARHKLVWDAQDVAAARCGVKILDPLPYLCHDGRCWGSKNGRPIYYDDDHLSEYGNKLLVPMFKQVFVVQ
ncbi:acyltransferase family protein [Escherichia coli]|uniref:acyltransferase family protein n=2 Tax=Escherichia coli TaxID=562 RepID=UPI0015859CF1|nr:acyltransferase family protein [Escherichia coli]EEW7014461.1 acyltransferase [Escherichia coli]EEW8994975.1 acyltransferase [Escherichia coli]EFA5104742.1 acyltransferase [Escherichia coli]EFC7945835.1 acyltransferase [Escherichia coli]EFF2264375.1 acyltransferase [Escherichia coli]